MEEAVHYLFGQRISLEAAPRDKTRPDHSVAIARLHPRYKLTDVAYALDEIAVHRQYV